MVDRANVIKGLEHCDFGGSGACYEKECPYYQSHDCTDELKNDILILLKEQEKRIKDLEEKLRIDISLKERNDNYNLYDTPIFGFND